MKNKNKKVILAASAIVFVTVGSTVGLSLMNRNPQVMTDHMLNDASANHTVSGLAAVGEVTVAEINTSNAVFVSTSGRDSTANGTEAKPYKTLAAAISAANPGDTIYVRGGTYSGELTINKSGTAGNPITIRNYPGEDVIFTAPSGSGCVVRVDADYINIVGIHIDNLTETNQWAAYGILIPGGHSNIIIQDCEITNIKANPNPAEGAVGNASGITLWGDASTPISNVLIQGNHIHDNKCGWSEAIAVNGYCEYVDVIGNTVHDNENIGIDIQGQYGTNSNESKDYARHVYVAENVTYNCVSPVDDSAGIYVDGAQDVLVERNLSYNNTIGIEVGQENGVSSAQYYAQNVTVANNLVYGNTSYGMELGGYAEWNNGAAKNIKVYNNTVINPADSDGYTICMNRGSGYTIENNIFADMGTWNELIQSNSEGTGTNTTNFSFKNNVLYHANQNGISRKQIIVIAGTKYSPTSFEALANNEGNIYGIAPALTSDYRLTEASPAVDTGKVNAEILSFQDYDGNARVGLMDMGCFQYTLASAVDKTLLKEKIDIAESLTEANYSADSWANMIAALGDGNTVYDDDDATQEEVDDARDALADAIAALALDYTPLDNALAQAATYKEVDYTPESWAVLVQAVTDGTTTRGKVLGDIYQGDINDAAQDILDGIAQLVARSGSITVNVIGYANGNQEDTVPVEGVTYKLYKVDETVTNETQALAYVEANNVAGTEATTDSDGQIVYNNLAIGRYYAQVVETSGSVTGVTKGFVVDIPMTAADGTTLEYNITVNPKVNLAFGNLKLIKKDSKGQAMDNVSFKLQIKKADDTWVDYEEDGNVVTLTSNSEGVITLSDLTQAKDGDTVTAYRLLETATKEGYIIDNKQLGAVTFNVNPMSGGIEVEGLDSTYDSTTNTTIVNLENSKPELTKKAKSLVDGEFKDSIGANAKDTVTFQVSVDVPTCVADLATFKVVDTLPAGLEYVADSLEVKGLVNDEYEVVETTAYTATNTNVTFVPANIASYKEIVITYDVTIDMDNAVIGGEGNVNEATLTYSKEIDVDGTEKSTGTSTDDAEVHTGALTIEKVEKANVAVKLQGAKFKIATTKANARAGIFVTDEEGNDIEVTTDGEGLAKIAGLAYEDDGTDTTYWLVETQAPTYTEEDDDGNPVEKSYTLLKDPVEVLVGKDTEDENVQIANAKEIDLPATGGIGMLMLVGLGSGLMTVSMVAKKKEEENK